MKKFLTFLALVCFMVAGAWAQTEVTTPKAYSETSKFVYKMHCSATDHGGNYINITGTTVDGRNTAGTYLAFELKEGTTNEWYIKDYASGLYLVLDGTNAVVSGSNSTSWTQDGNFFNAGGGHLNNNGALAVRGGTGGCSQWVLEEYELTEKTYTVTITGAPAGQNPTVVYGTNDPVGDGGSITAAGLTKDQLVASVFEGYAVDITIEGTTITVTYSVHIAAFPDAGTYYVTLTNKDTGKRPYIHNALAESTYTLQSETPGTTNDYIWKVVSDGAGNITSIVNGDGRGVGTNGQYQGRVTSLQYKDKGNGYYYLYSSVIKNAKNDHECLNRSNGGYATGNGWTVTTWVGENNADNQWKVETVDVSALNVYNVVVTGAENAYVTYSTTDEYAYNGGFFLATSSISETDLVASTIPAYTSTVSVSGSTITVTYEVDPSQLELNALIAEAEAAYADNDEPLDFGDNLITANNQFSSNASQSGEGSLDNLLDENLSTFWHSQWDAGNQPMHKHYLQVSLTEPISGPVKMTMGRRSGAANDHPVKMSVEYSADNNTYTLLPGFMEFSATTGYVIGTFNLPTNAQYLRFFNDDSNGTNDRGYWHCSEFQLNKVTKSNNLEHPTEAATFLAALATAKAITSGATQTDVQTLQAALDTYKNAVNPVITSITWNLYDGTTLLTNETQDECKKDRQYTTTLTVPFGYLIQGNKTVTATDEDQTIDLQRVVDPNFPFEYADSKDNIEHWYALNIHCNNKHYVYYSASATPNVKADVTTYEKADEYAWGFVGNPTDGFVIYNKASETALYSADNDTSCTVGSTASTFKATLTGWATAQADGGFCLNVEGQQYVNFQGNELKHWSDNDAGSTFHVVELNFSAPKTYAFVLTGPDETEYEGTFSSNEENPRPACVEGFILSNENWEDVSEYGEVDYVYTADFEFPFPVSYDGTDGHFTYIYSFKDTRFAWQADGTNVKTVQAEEPSGENFVWAIIPAFKDGAFTYKVMNIATQSYIYSTNATNSHDAGIVTLDEVGSDLTYSGEAFVLPNGYYLSLNSSNKSDGTVQYVGTWGSVHGGTKLMFEEYVPVTSIDITIGETGYATMAYYDDFVKPEGLKVYYCIDEGEAGHLTPVEWERNYLPGYCAYILEGEPGTYTFNYTASDFEYPEEDYDALVDVYNNGVLYGNFDDTDMTVEEAKAYYGENIYVFSRVDGKMGFYKYAGTTLAAHKAFYATDEASIQGFALDFGGQTVGVNTVLKAANLKAGFDIQGRRINSIQKGINILNGKKIIK